MGFWSSVGSVIGGAISSICRGVKSVVSGVSGWIKENILGISDLPEYNSRNATVDQTKIVNEVLEKCIRSYGTQAEEYDELAKNIIEDQFNMLKSRLEEVNRVSQKEIIGKYIFLSFDSNAKSIKRSLDKIYSKQIANVFSLNNNELLNLLSLKKSDEKQEKIQNLALKTITDANKRLMEELSKFINEQQSFIIEKLKEYMGKMRNDLITAKKATEKVIEASEKDIESQKEIEEKYKKNIEKLNMLIKILMEEAC